MSDPWAAKYGKWAGNNSVAKPAVVARPATIKAGASMSSNNEKKEQEGGVAQNPPTAVPTVAVTEEKKESTSTPSGVPSMKVDYYGNLEI